jgi:predicted HicB family RNase H-like nuclease
MGYKAAMTKKEAWMNCRVEKATKHAAIAAAKAERRKLSNWMENAIHTAIEATNKAKGKKK